MKNPVNQKFVRDWDGIGIRGAKGASFEDWKAVSRVTGHRVLGVKNREGDVADAQEQNTGFRIARTRK